MYITLILISIIIIIVIIIIIIRYIYAENVVKQSRHFYDICSHKYRVVSQPSQRLS